MQWAIIGLAGLLAVSVGATERTRVSVVAAQQANVQELTQQSNVLVDMRDLSPHELRSEGFVLGDAQTIRIEAVGAAKAGGSWFARDDHREEWPGNAWILNARTRDVVWELRREDTRSGRRNLEHYEGRVSLPAGTYEVFYASYTALWPSNRVNLSWLIGRRDRPRYDDGGLSEDFRLLVRGAGRRLNVAELQRLHDELRAHAVVRLTSAQREQVEQIGFELSKPTTLEIYAVGEVTDGDQFDYGWIVNANTMERVWSFDYRGSQPAGGARKNRQVRETRTLPAGRYAAIFALDDSHDPRDWNAAPPYDPEYWGLTVRVNAEDRAGVQNFSYDPTPDDLAIATVTRMRNSQTRSQGFTLTQPLDVRVYALGEGSDSQMHDYGWIIDAGSRRRVWSMTYDRTEHAGGAQKNRRVNEVVRLEPGSYLLYFRTDDSHAFRSWNSPAPLNADDWGISLFPANGSLDHEIVVPYQPVADDTAAIIARITNVGDDETRSRTFTLDTDSDVRIYALGEGDGEMHDYAWVENLRTRHKAWEMSYRLTEHAGGADKNRVFDGVIRLPAGEYVLRYRSDGSHSPNAWNAEPPFDPGAWGVALYLVKGR
ncbi:MAG: hypothetical protein ACRENP_26575 [Longimicrobiales bacterium]